MERPVDLIFTSDILSRIDITGKLSKDYKYKINYAQAEQIEIEEGTIICQHFSHYLFFMEMVEMNLHTDLHSSYLIKDPSVFFFFMLEGNIIFSTTEGDPIARARKGICYATYNKAWRYLYQLSAGIHRMFYITPRPAWLIKNIDFYPKLKPFMESLNNSDSMFGHMPACVMNSAIYDHLMGLLDLEGSKEEDMETQQQGMAKKVLAEYQHMVDIKLAHPVYRIKYFLEENYADSELSNQTLIKFFHTTEKMLIEKFKEEFGTTPHAYLIYIRLHKAKQLFTEDQLSTNEVYKRVGYKDVQSFRIQYKKFFGYPPSNIH